MNEQFIAADIALFGTTSQRSPWREPVVDVLGQLGVEEPRVFNPVIDPEKTGREWDPDFDGPHERWQKANAHNSVFFLGAGDNNEVSAYSSSELMLAISHREPATLAVALDSSLLATEHAKKQMRAIESDIRDYSPDVPVMHSPGEVLGWIVDRLDLTGQLASFALDKASINVDEQYARMTSPVAAPPTPDQYEGSRQDLLRQQVDPEIKRIEEMMQNGTMPNGGVSLHKMGACAWNSEASREQGHVIAEHFRDLGWSVGSNRDSGDLEISKPVPPLVDDLRRRKGRYR